MHLEIARLGKPVRTLTILLTLAGAVWADAAEPATQPHVRPDRPRLFLRAKAWDGPSVEKIKQWMDRPEYKAHWDKVLKHDEYSMNLALR